MDAAAGGLTVRGKSMLAQPAMAVVFVLVEFIRLGCSFGHTAESKPKGASSGRRSLKVPQRRSFFGNEKGGTGKPLKRETQIW